MEKITKPTLKIVITGPESTGKSTLSKQLSEYFEQPWLPEYARTYLNIIQRPYDRNDLVEIAKGQIKNEDDLFSTAPPLVFLDTSLEVLKVWSEWKYNFCDQFISNNLKARPADLYLLLSPDLAWENDPLRENPHDREIIFNIYKKELKKLDRPFEIITDLGLLRTQQAINSVKTFIGQ